MPPIVQSVIVDIETNFEKRVFEEARISVERLDAEIRRLQADALAIKDKGTPQFAALTKEVGNLTQERNKLTAAIDKGNSAQARGADSLSKFQSASNLAKNAIGALGVSIGLVEFTRFVSGSIRAAAQLEKMTNSFKSFGVSANDARRLVNELDGLAATLPFEGEQITAVAQNLIKFNIAAEDTPKIVTQIAAVASGAGFSFDALSDAYGRARATGNLFGRDFLQLYKNIPGLVEAIAKSTGKSVEEVVKLGKQGKISFDDLSKGVEVATSATGKYGKVLTEYQQTFEGSSKRLREAFGDIKEAFGQGLLRESASGANDLTNALKRLEPAANLAGRGLAFLATSLINTFTGKSAFEIQGEIIKGIRQQNARLKEFLVSEYNKLFNQVKTEFKGGLPFDPEAGLTEEEKEKLREVRKNAEQYLYELNQQIRRAAVSRSDIGIQLISEDQKDFLSKKLKQDVAAIQLDYENRITKLKKDAQDFADKGVPIDISLQLRSLKAEEQSKINEIKKVAERQLSNQIGILSPLIRLQPIYELKSEPEIDDDITRIVNTLLLDPIQNKLKGTKVKLQAPEVQVQEGESRTGVQKLFSNISDAFKDPKFLEQLDVFNNAAKDALDTFLNSELAKTDFLVSETEKRLNQLLSVQEGGNAEQIALEQKRLNALTEQRLKFQERQKAIDAAQILAANAVSAAESIKAITSAFGKSGGNPIVGIAASIALAATIAATIAALNSSFGQIPAFWEGAERVSDKLKPSRAGRDGYLTRVDGGERIVPTDLNKRIPSFVKNKDLPGLVELGLVASGGGMNDKNIIREQKLTNALLMKQSKLIRNQSIKLELVGNDSEKVRLQRMRK